MDMASLSPDERVTYVIGEIQRGDVRVEELLRSLWRLLAEGAGIEGIPGRDFKEVFPDVKRMLSQSDVGEVTKAAGAELFEAVFQVHKERNRIVHDRWVMDPERETVWVSARFRPPTQEDVPDREYQSFVACRVKLQRMYWRVSALFEILFRHIHPDQAGHDFDSIDLAIMADRFDMRESGQSITASARRHL